MVGVRRRQVHDLAPQPAPAVLEYAAELKSCPDCQKTAVGEFPQGVNAPAQYGPELTARVADVVLGHHVPVHRSTMLVADTLLEALQVATAARDAGRDELTGAELTAINGLYAGALARARADNPASDTAILAGHARTLANRFDTHRETILRFTTNLDVGLTNNVAERAVRPVKVQQRSSGGCWRTLEGLAQFAVVQSYLSTASYWGLTRFDALHRLFTTGPWIPPGLSPVAAAA